MRLPPPPQRRAREAWRPGLGRGRGMDRVVIGAAACGRAAAGEPEPLGVPRRHAGSGRRGTQQSRAARCRGRRVIPSSDEELVNATPAQCTILSASSAWPSVAHLSRSSSAVNEMFDRAREDLLEQARFASASEGMNTAIGRGPRGVGAEPQIVGSAQKPSWPQRSPAAGARSAAIASASHRGPGRYWPSAGQCKLARPCTERSSARTPHRIAQLRRAGAGVTKDAKKRQQPSSSSSSSPSRPQRPGDSSSPGGRHGSTSKADAARLKVQQQRRQQAGQATRRANSLASQRMAQLQMSEEELERRVESLTPFATLVQRPGSPGVAQGGTGERCRCCAILLCMPPCF